MIKICFVTTIGGTIKIFILKLAQFLYETGEFDISFICSPDDELEKATPEYIHIFPVPMERGISLGGLKSAFQIWNIFRKEKFDIIQYSTPNASCYASIGAWLVRTKVRLYCQWGIVYVGFEGLKRIIFKLEEKMVCRLSSWIEPDSKSNLDFSHKEGLYPYWKGSVVWNGSASGVDLTRFDISKKKAYNAKIREKYGIPENDFVFGFVGRITADKGINELFAATKDFFLEHEDAWLVLVGASELSNDVDNNLFNWAEKSERVIFVGYTSVVEQYIATMDCFILPSYREGFGMSVVEAEAMGVPVIVSNIPGPIDGMINNKTGLIIPKKDSGALKMAMEKVFTSPELCIEFGENGQKFASDNFEQNELFKKILMDRKELLFSGKPNKKI